MKVIKRTLTVVWRRRREMEMQLVWRKEKGRREKDVALVKELLLCYWLNYQKGKAY